MNVALYCLLRTRTAQKSASVLLREQVTIPAAKAGLSSEVEALTVGTDTKWNAITTHSREIQQQEGEEWKRKRGRWGRCLEKKNFKLENLGGKSRGWEEVRHLVIICNAAGLILQLYVLLHVYITAPYLWRLIQCHNWSRAGRCYRSFLFDRHKLDIDLLTQLLARKQIQFPKCQTISLIHIKYTQYIKLTFLDIITIFKSSCYHLNVNV